MQTSHIIITAALLLAACDKPSEDDGTMGNATANNSAVQTDVQDNVAATNSFSPENAASGKGAVPAAQNAIPAAFHGRWGMVPGDCGPDVSIAKGLMTVDGAQLRFYESVGKPAVVTNPTPNSIEGRFSFTGEGMEWSKDIVLTLEGNGDKMVRAESAPKASYRYTRCPA